MLMLVVKRKLFWGVDVESYIVPFCPCKSAFRMVFKQGPNVPGRPT